MYEPENIDKIFNWKLITYDYGAFTVTFNKPGYHAILELSDDYEYFYGGYLLISTPKDTQI